MRAFITKEPSEMARRCREQAGNCDDPQIAAFLRELAADYEAQVEQDQIDDDSAGDNS